MQFKDFLPLAGKIPIMESFRLSPHQSFRSIIIQRGLLHSISTLDQEGPSLGTSPWVLSPYLGQMKFHAAYSAPSIAVPVPPPSDWSHHFPLGWVTLQKSSCPGRGQSVSVVSVGLPGPLFPLLGGFGGCSWRGQGVLIQ